MTKEEQTMLMDVTTENLDYSIARVAHEANRAYCIGIGDKSQPRWEDAPDWQRHSAMQGVAHVRQFPDSTPEDSHESWLVEKARTGWSYGPVKDADRKEHPCFVPYEQLPPEQRRKDALFLAVVKALL